MISSVVIGINGKGKNITATSGGPNELNELAGNGTLGTQTTSVAADWPQAWLHMMGLWPGVAAKALASYSTVSGVDNSVDSGLRRSQTSPLPSVR